ncbi:MAG: hypothetical protein ACYCUV_08795 [Phycisphaerae bacterium]
MVMRHNIQSNGHQVITRVRGDINAEAAEYFPHAKLLINEYNILGEAKVLSACRPNAIWRTPVVA